jgi:hypothetical protein
MADLQIVEHEEDGVVAYFVTTDLNPDEFPEAPSLGPFPTREEAEAAIVAWDQEIVDDAPDAGTPTP